MSVIQYSFHNRAWTRLDSSLGQHRGSHGAVVVAGKIYAIGGGGMSSNLDSVEMYDGWKLLSPMKFSRHALVVVAFAGSLFAIGGTTSGTTGLNNSSWAQPLPDGCMCTNIVERYDIRDNEWHLCAPLQFARRLHGACEFKGSIYVFGGCRDAPEWFTNEVEVYDIKSDSWFSLNPVPMSGAMSAVTASGAIFVMVHGKGLYRYNPVCSTYDWLGNYPIHDWHCFSVAVIEENIFLCGGMSRGNLCSDCYRFDTRAVEAILRSHRDADRGISDISNNLSYLWKHESCMPKARRRSALVAVRV
jgi:hypothetical protein